MGHVKLSVPLCCSQSRRQPRWYMCPQGSTFAVCMATPHTPHVYGLRQLETEQEFKKLLEGKSRTSPCWLSVT